jgi:hypothetical protein
MDFWPFYEVKFKVNVNSYDQVNLDFQTHWIYWNNNKHGLVVKQIAHDREVVGSNPGTVYWMDVSNLLAITLKKNWK